jgi:hypothetical protein
VDSKPRFFPDEFYWLVGCTEPGFASHGDRIRNGYGSNVSYRREAFLAVGGYDAKTGRRGERHIQAHEAPVGIKLARGFQAPIVYSAEAIVIHNLFEYRGRFKWLIFRSFWQGYSKWLLNQLYSGYHQQELEFVRKILLVAIPNYLIEAAKFRKIDPLLKSITIAAFLCSTSMGYLYGVLGYRQHM